MADKLTPKQALFCKEYMVDFNGTQAAIRAGYSESSDGKKYYVYFLINPETGHIFYVGKGSNKRVYRHVKEAKKGIVDNVNKYNEIMDLLDRGLKPIEYIFYYTNDENDAFKVEREIIYRFKNYGLTNISYGVSDNKELVKMKSENLLRRMIPYGLWAKNISDYDRTTCINVFGSTHEAYYSIHDGLMELADSNHG